MRLPVQHHPPGADIVKRFRAVPASAPYDVAERCRRIGAALDGRVRPAGTARIADYDWSGTARHYVELYRPAVRRAS